MQAWKWGPALACGNTLVLKPAEQTPLTALRVAKLAQDVGFPDGVINVVPGYGPTAGAALSGHMDVDKIAFTGETGTGKIVMTAAAQSNLKRVSLELGGKSPERGVRRRRPGRGRRGGVLRPVLQPGAVLRRRQPAVRARSRCTTSSSHKMLAKAKGRKVGDPFDLATEQGPQVSQEQMDRVLGYIDARPQGRGKDADRRRARRRPRDTSWSRPCSRDVKDEMTIAQEEIFGPVMSILKFKDADEVHRARQPHAATGWPRRCGRRT